MANRTVFRNAPDFHLADWLIPRPLAWISYANDERVGLLNGFTAACYHPLTLFCSAKNFPTTFREARLSSNRTSTTLWSVSLVTSRDSEALKSVTDLGAVYHHEELGLKRSTAKLGKYPESVATSPIQMYCSIKGTTMSLEESDDLVLLIVDVCRVDGTVISDPTPSMIERSITAKIDATLIDALAWVGGSDDVAKNIVSSNAFRSMPRPKQSADLKSWKSTDFSTPMLKPSQSDFRNDVEWCPEKDGGSCPLGFNATTAVVLSRPIGWISTYSKQGRVPHLAPYSFFMDVGPDLVAFSAYSSGDSGIKDAQKDAEETGVFCYNMVTADLAVSMNYSAAPLPRDGSEFTLAGLTPEQASSVDAPVVQESPVRFECEYVRTISGFGGFSMVVGRVKEVSIASRVLSAEGLLDVRTMAPVARLGYMDEYSIY
jgi:flavin reductase (DIM6/NTAB) family NADH-FMN oxidoreductase RutF